MDMRHGAGRVSENHIQRYQRVSHPENRSLGALIDKQHPLTARHLFNEHQTLAAFRRFIRQIDRKMRLSPIATKIDLFGTTRGECA